MAPLEPWERVFVSEDFLQTVHGSQSCVSCHNGIEPAQGKDEAHTGLTAYPSEDAQTACGTCHSAEVASFENSLHKTQEGYFKRYELRAGYDMRSAGHEKEIDEFNHECGTCHTSCGQCHVSRPRTALGGFIDGQAHVFKKTPSMQENCTACHGSRVGDEYTGANLGTLPDVHYFKLAKRCEFCHTGDEMHGGDGTLLTYRYDENNTAMPQCDDCHSDTSAGMDNEYHQAHSPGGTAGVALSCHVCHAQTYKNCNGCHAGGDGITGNSYLAFEIGRNYLTDNDRYSEYDYITVRHIPVAPNTFEEWGVSDLANFASSEPTWKMTTPHNIQRWTPQTEVAEGQTCSAACHDSAYYLQEDDIEQYSEANGGLGYGFDDLVRELLANEQVIIP